MHVLALLMSVCMQELSPRAHTAPAGGPAQKLVRLLWNSHRGGSSQVVQPGSGAYLASTWATWGLHQFQQHREPWSKHRFRIMVTTSMNQSSSAHAACAEQLH